MNLRHLRRIETIGRGQDAFERARAKLFAYTFYPRTLVSAPGPIVEGMTLHQKVRVGPLRFDGPVRVIGWWDRPAQCGYRYEALSGHVEHGTATFELTREGDDVRFLIESDSAMRHWLARLGTPIARRVQRYAIDEAFKSMRKAAAGDA